MKDLIIAAYDGSLQALRMLNAITELKFSWLSDVSSALVVTRDAEGRLDVQATYRPGAHQGPEGPAGAAAPAQPATEHGEFFFPADIGLPSDFLSARRTGPARLLGDHRAGGMPRA